MEDRVIIPLSNPSISPDAARNRQIRGLCREFNRIPRDFAQARSKLVQIREMLDSLSLSNFDFDRAVSQINNASRYVESAEFGAARYEIRLLRRALKSIAQSALTGDLGSFDSLLFSATG